MSLRPHSDPESPSAYFKDFEIKLKTSPLAWAWFTCLKENYNTYRQREWTALQEEHFGILMVEDAVEAGHSCLIFFVKSTLSYI